MRGCGKVLVIDFDKLSHRGVKLFGENCLLLVVISALKSQRRVRYEFSEVCFYRN